MGAAFAKFLRMAALACFGKGPSAVEYLNSKTIPRPREPWGNLNSTWGIGLAPPGGMFTLWLLLLVISGEHRTARADGAVAGAAPVLFIGDSIAYGRFGKTIDASLRATGAVVTTEASCGTTPSSWLDGKGRVTTPCGFWKKAQASEERVTVHLTPKIGEELQTLHPGLTVIQLGTNIAAGRNPLLQQPDVARMMQEVRAAGSQCIWIGPPDASSPVVTREKLRLTNEMIRTEAARQGCFFIDSLSFTHFPDGLGGDGIHPSPELSAEWGSREAAEVRAVQRKMQPTGVQVSEKKSKQALTNAPPELPVHLPPSAPMVVGATARLTPPTVSEATVPVNVVARNHDDASIRQVRARILGQFIAAGRKAPAEAAAVLPAPVAKEIRTSAEDADQALDRALAVLLSINPGPASRDPVWNGTALRGADPGHPGCEGAR